MRLNPKYAICLIAIVYILASFYHKNWTKAFLHFNGDSLGYYSYLPSILIHNDIKTFEKTTFYRFKYAGQYAPDFDKFAKGEIPKPPFTVENYDKNSMTTGAQIPNGNRLIGYTCGVSILQLPFFLTAHVLAPILGYAPDGFSTIYIFMTFMGNVFYVLLGLFFLMKILGGYITNDNTISSVLITTALATNLFFFTIYSNWMSHSYLFFLCNILIFNTIQYYSNFKLKYLIGIAWSLGMILLIRPTDVIFCIFPLFFKVYSWSSFKERMAFFYSTISKMGIAFGVSFMTIFPQLLYWKYVTGSWIFNSYGESLKFDFTKSCIHAGLFSGNNGWLVYTPIMGLAVIGLLFALPFQKILRKDWFLPLILILPLHIYIIYSWWCWSYINGFGSRPMIETYPFWAIPLSIVLGFLIKKPFTALLAGLMMVFFIYLNIFQTNQQVTGQLLSEVGSKAFIIQTLGKSQIDKSDLMAFDCDIIQPKSPTLIKILAEEHFEDSTDGNFVRRFGDDKAHNGQFSYLLRPNTYSKTLESRDKDIEKGRWVKVCVWANAAKVDIFRNYDQSLLYVEFYRNGALSNSKQVRIENKLNNTAYVIGGAAHIWDNVDYFVPIPSDFNSNTDFIKARVWSFGEKELLIDDMKLELYK
jgi:hypothetical protein